MESGRQCSRPPSTPYVVAAVGASGSRTLFTSTVHPHERRVGVDLVPPSWKHWPTPTNVARSGGEMPKRLLIPLLTLLLAAAAPPLPSQLNDPSTTEGYIWQQAQAGDVADLNDRCGTPPLSIYQRKDPLWQAPCRRVDPDLLRALLTQPDLADHAPHGVLIRGAHIDGDLDLHDAHVRAAEVWLEASWIAGNADPPRCRARWLALSSWHAV